MSLYKELVRFAEDYKDTMFEAYTRVWEVGIVLDKYWKSIERNYPNPFCVKNEDLRDVKLRDAMKVVSMYWKCNPANFLRRKDSREMYCVEVACNYIMSFIQRVMPSLIKVSINTGHLLRSYEFDYDYSFGSEYMRLYSDIDKVLKKHEGCDIWIEMSRILLRYLGCRALAYKIYNPYNNKIVQSILFTNERLYIPEYEDYLVVGWNSCVRQYTYSICDTKQNVINAYSMLFNCETDESFDKEIKCYLQQ